MKLALKARRKLATAISRKLLPDEFSIISDDCWGGQIYRQLNIPYLTPTVGLWIRPKDYLNYIEQFELIHQSDLEFVPSEHNYPVAILSGVEVHFMHFETQEQSIESYFRRLKRINQNNLMIKIDFGKPGYTAEDIKRWNKMRLPHSIAFYPTDLEVPDDGIHNGIAVPDWVLDGAAMFNITRKHFDIFTWIQSGIISSSFLYSSVNSLLLDPTSPRRLANKALEATSLKRRASA